LLDNILKTKNDKEVKRFIDNFDKNVKKVMKGLNLNLKILSAKIPDLLKPSIPLNINQMVVLKKIENGMLLLIKNGKININLV